MKKKPSVIVPKETLSRPPTEEVEEVKVTKKVEERVSEPIYAFATDIQTVNKEFPKLAELYADLKVLITQEFAGFRSNELKRNWEHSVARQRILIRNFEKENNISRQDHLRWAGII